MDRLNVPKTHTHLPQRYRVFGIVLILLAFVSLSLFPEVVPFWPESQFKTFIVTYWLPMLPESRVGLAILGSILFAIGFTSIFLPKIYLLVHRLLRSAPKWTWLVFAVSVIAFTSTFSILFLRHYALGCFALLATGVWFHDVLRMYRDSSYYAKVAIAFLFLSLSVKAVPGGYLPPFFNGIHGWTNRLQGLPQVSTIGGLKLVREDGESIWFANAFTLPQNMFYRQLHIISQQDEHLRDALDAYYSMYERAYPHLVTGRFKSEQYLGVFSYPGHNPFRMLNYADFPPERIVGFQRVDEWHNVASGELEKNEILFEYLFAGRMLARSVRE